ncbi:MAG: GxxExxY protein [Anaerolinea sp.]|nr:GxxExxY protein [Anaerolinea sp.]
MGENQLTHTIIGAAIEVHRELGPGLLESAYEECLAHEFTLRGLAYQRQKPLPVFYKGIQVECGFRLDFLVEEAVVVELKAVEQLSPVHQAQVMTYLKLAQCRLGLLINFNSFKLLQGLKRIILDS